MLKKSARQAEYFSPWTLRGELPLRANGKNSTLILIEADNLGLQNKKQGLTGKLQM